MPFTSPADLADIHDGWRSLTNSLTAAQVEHLAAKERHPAYTTRPGFLFLEALEFVTPGCVAEHLVAQATRP
jgi:hypothetical protein